MKTIGKIDTTTLLLIGAAVVGVYILTRPATPVYNPYAVSPYGTALPTTALQLQQQSLLGNPTAQDISASGTALQGLSSLIGNFF